jgi:chaperone BCS1
MCHEAARSQREEDVKRVDRLAKEFAARVPELRFSPAEVLSFLLEYRHSPEEAIDNVEQLISKPKSKPPKVSEDARPRYTRPEINRASK